MPFLSAHVFISAIVPSWRGVGRAAALVAAAWTFAGVAGHAMEAPSSIAVPGKVAALTVHAEGIQLYECKAAAEGPAAWTFREPVATLMHDGKTVGRHFAGPTWEFADGSAIVGKVTGQAPGETKADAAWLRLAVVSQSGEGALSKVADVQRITTHGGAYGGSCTQPGALHAEPYSADYVFFAG